jgi:hypothetical protein
MRKLVKYSYDMIPHTIFESSGFDFRVSPNEGAIAIVHSEDNDYRVSFFNGGGIIQFNMELDKFEEDLIPHLYGWSDDSRYFWGTLQHTYIVDSYFIVDTKDWSVRTIDNVKSYGNDMAINTNNGWLCYSDYPVCLDIQCRDDFIESGKEVELWLYNIFTEEFRRIAGSVTKEFNPVWTGENTFEYDAPINDSRIRYIMDLEKSDVNIHESLSDIVDFMYFDTDSGSKHFSEDVYGWELADIVNHWIGVLSDKGISYGSMKNGENILSKLKVNSIVEENNLITVDFNEVFLEFDNDESEPYPFIVCMNYIIYQITDVGISNITNTDEVRITVDGTDAIDLIQPDGPLKREVFSLCPTWN